MVVLDLVETTPDLTLVEVQERLMKERSERFGISTIWRFFGGHRITLNKKIGHAVEQDRPDVLKRRREWFEDQVDLEPERSIFIDEAGGVRNSLYGWPVEHQAARALTKRSPKMTAN